MAAFDLDPDLILSIQAVLGGGVDQATLDAAAEFLSARFESGPRLSQSLWGDGIRQRENIVSFLRSEYQQGRGAGDPRTMQQLASWYTSGPSEGQRGNPTYVARRLANTEAAYFFQALDNAFDAEAEADGLIDGYEILLSPDHPERDECDLHAEGGPYPSLEETPEPPFHPLCQCRRRPVLLPESERLRKREEARRRRLSGEIDPNSIQGGLIRFSELMYTAQQVRQVLGWLRFGYQQLGNLGPTGQLMQFFISNAAGYYFQIAKDYVREFVRRAPPVAVEGQWFPALAGGATGPARIAGLLPDPARSAPPPRLPPPNSKPMPPAHRRSLATMEKAIAGFASDVPTLRELRVKPPPAHFSPEALLRALAPKPEPQRWQLELIERMSRHEALALAEALPALLSGTTFRGALVWKEFEGELANLRAMTDTAKPVVLVLEDHAGIELGHFGLDSELLTPPGSTFAVREVGQAPEGFVITLRHYPSQKDAGSIDYGPIAFYGQYADQAKALYDERIALDGEDLLGILLADLPDEEVTRIRFKTVIENDTVLYMDIATKTFVANRTFHPGFVSHDSFSVLQEFQGSGIGGTFVANSLNLYRTLGIEEVRLLAFTSPPLANGAYTWARLGWIPSTESMNATLLHNLQDLLDEKEQRLVREFGIEKVNEARRVLYQPVFGAPNGAYAVWELSDIPGLGRRLLAETEAIGWTGKFRFDNPLQWERVRQRFGMIPVAVLDEQIAAARFAVEGLRVRQPPRLPPPTDAQSIRARMRAAAPAPTTPLAPEESLPPQFRALAYGGWGVGDIDTRIEQWNLAFPPLRGPASTGRRNGVQPIHLLEGLEQVMPQELASAASLNIVFVGPSDSPIRVMYRWPGFAAEVKFHEIDRFRINPDLPVLAAFDAEVVAFRGSAEGLKLLLAALAGAMALGFAADAVARIDVPGSLISLRDALAAGLFPINTNLDDPDLIRENDAAARLAIERQLFALAPTLSGTEAAYVRRLFGENFFQTATTLEELLASVLIPESRVLSEFRTPDITYSMSFAAADDADRRRQLLGPVPVRRDNETGRLVIGENYDILRERIEDIADRWWIEQRPWSTIVPVLEPEAASRMTLITTDVRFGDREAHLLATMFRPTTLEELEEWSSYADEEQLEIWNTVIGVPPALLSEYVKLAALPHESGEQDIAMSIETIDQTAIQIQWRGGGIVRMSRSFSFSLIDDDDPAQGFDYLVVSHDYFKVAPSAQGQGTALKANRLLMNLYERIGVDEVEIYASLDAGGYVWARFGFAPIEPASVNSQIAQRAVQLDVFGEPGLTSGLAQQALDVELPSIRLLAEERIDLDEGVEEEIEELERNLDRARTELANRDDDDDTADLEDNVAFAIAELERARRDRLDRIRWLVEEIVDERLDELKEQFEAPEVVFSTLLERNVEAWELDTHELTWEFADSKYGKKVMAGMSWTGRLELHSDAHERFREYTLAGVPFMVIDDRIRELGGLSAARRAINGMVDQIRTALHDAEVEGGLDLRDEAINRFLARPQQRPGTVDDPDAVMENIISAMSGDTPEMSIARMRERLRAAFGVYAPLDVLYSARALRGLGREELAAARFELRDGTGLQLNLSGIRLVFDETGLSVFVADSRARAMSRLDRLKFFADTTALARALNRAVTFHTPPIGAAEMVPLLLAGFTMDIPEAAIEAALIAVQRGEIELEGENVKAGAEAILKRENRSAATKLQALARVLPLHPILDRLALRVNRFSTDSGNLSFYDVLHPQTFTPRTLQQVMESNDPEPSNTFITPIRDFGETLDEAVMTRAHSLADIRATYSTKPIVEQINLYLAPYRQAQPSALEWHRRVGEEGVERIEQILEVYGGINNVMRIAHAVPLPPMARFGNDTGLINSSYSANDDMFELDMRYPGAQGSNLSVTIRLFEDRSRARVLVSQWVEPNHLRSDRERFASINAFVEMAHLLGGSEGIADFFTLGQVSVRVLSLLPQAGFVFGVNRDSAFRALDEIADIIRDRDDLGNLDLAARVRFDAHRARNNAPAPDFDSSLKAQLSPFARVYLAFADNEDFVAAFVDLATSSNGYGHGFVLAGHELSREFRQTRLRGGVPSKTIFMTPEEQRLGRVEGDPYNEESRAEAVMTGPLERIEEIKATNTDVEIQITDKGE